MPVLEWSLDEAAKKISTVHGPYWNSRLDVSKVVLTITAAVLVGTVSFSSSLIGPGKEDLQWQWSLFLSWGLFLISGAASVYAMWHLYKLNAYHVLLTNRQPYLEKKLKEIGPRNDEAQLKREIDRKILSITNETLSPLALSDKYSHRLLAIQLGSFVTALLVFIIFGIAQIV